jgi:O-antigen ligase
MHTGSPLPAFLPLTVCSQATEMELYRFLAYFAVFLLIINNIRSPRQIRRIVFIIIAVGLFESLYGLIEYFSGRYQIFFYKKQSFSVSGTFVNKNHFAGYMEMVIPLTFGVLFSRLEERSHVPLKKIVRLFDEKYMKVVLVSFLLFVMICAELLSGSRGGVVSFACGMLCLVILAYNRRLLRKWALAVLILVIVSVGITVLLGYDLIVARLQTLIQLETELSFQLRLGVWRNTISMFRDFPIFGSGFGTFSHIFPQYQTFVSDLTFFYAENDYLQVLAETGIIGIILVICVGITFFYTTLKAWKQRHSRWSIVMVAGGVSALFSIVVHSSIDFNLHIPSNALLFSVIAALSYVAAHSHRRSS